MWALGCVCLEMLCRFAPWFLDRYEEKGPRAFPPDQLVASVLAWVQQGSLPYPDVFLNGAPAVVQLAKMTF